MKSLLALWALALVASALDVNVRFFLGKGGSRSSSLYVLNSEEFLPLDHMSGYYDSLDEGKAKEDKVKELAEQEVEVRLVMVESEDVLDRLVEFWTGDPADDIDAATFTSFIKASNYVGLLGEAAERFARNIARKGLLGKHFAEIFKTCPLERPGDWEELSWQLFIAFSSETGCEVRVSDTRDVTLCSADDPKAETYGSLATLLNDKRLAVRNLSIRCKTLGKRENASNRMEILAWLLWQLRVPSLSIDSAFKVTPEDIKNLDKATKALESRNGILCGPVLEGLDLSSCRVLGLDSVKALISVFTSLRELRIGINDITLEPGTVLEGWDKLEKLNLYISCPNSSSLAVALIPNLLSLKELMITTRESLSIEAADAFKGRDKLERLCIHGAELSSEFFERIIPSLSFVEELDVEAECLSRKAGNAFRKCRNLKKLVFSGSNQNSEFIEALMPHPSLKELSIKAESLSDEAANAFNGCEGFEKLCIYGPKQNSRFVKTLISNIFASLKELDIPAEELSDGAANTFKGCVKLERLCLYGSDQTLSFVKTVVPYLTSLKELTMNVEDLSNEAANVFNGCERLEKLCLYGLRQSLGFFKALLMPNLLRSLKELEIGVEVLSDEAASAFKGYSGLERLCLYGSNQTLSFVETVMPYLASLKELRMNVEALSEEAANAFKGCVKLEILRLGGPEQSSKFVKALLIPNTLTSLKEFKMTVESLSDESVRAFEGCVKLERLYLYGFNQNSRLVETIMPYLTYLKELTMNVEEGLSEEAANAFKESDRLEKLSLYMSRQSSRFAEIIMPYLTSLKELEVIVENLNDDAADAFKKCTGLEMLSITGCLKCGFFNRLLSTPLRGSLKVLTVVKLSNSQGLSDLDEKAVLEAQARCVRINIYG